MPPRVRRDLLAITSDGMAFSVMVAVGERTLQQFSLALGHGEVTAGLVATLPMVVGALAQLAGPRLVIAFGSLRRAVCFGATLQALAFVPLALAAWRGSLGALPLFGCATLYHFGGLFAAPAWSAWMDTLVPPSIRERFFGRREALCQAALFVGLVLAGAFLHAAADARLGLTAFAVLFATASVARFVATGFLASQSEPEPLPEGIRDTRPLDVLRRPADQPAIRALFGWVPFLAAAHVAQAFFTPWARRGLGFPDDAVLWLTAAEFLGRMVALPAFGVVARNRGARFVLWIGAFGLAPVALLWTLDPGFWWLAAVQFLAGCAWGAFELGGFLLFFELVPRGERTAVLAVHFLARTLAMIAGSIVGSAVLFLLGTTALGWFVLFLVSTAARLAALRLIARAPPRRASEASVA